MVRRDLGEEQFKQALRVHFPDLPEDFELCKVNSQRQIIPLQLECFTPDQIHSDNALGRSAIYIHLKVSKLLYNIYIILKYSKHGCTAHRPLLIKSASWHETCVTNTASLASSLNHKNILYVLLLHLLLSPLSTQSKSSHFGSDFTSVKHTQFYIVLHSYSLAEMPLHIFTL